MNLLLTFILILPAECLHFTWKDILMTDQDKAVVYIYTIHDRVDLESAYCDDHSIMDITASSMTIDSGIRIAVQTFNVFLDKCPKPWKKLKVVTTKESIVVPNFRPKGYIHDFSDSFSVAVDICSESGGKNYVYLPCGLLQAVQDQCLKWHACGGRLIEGQPEHYGNSLHNSTNLTIDHNNKECMPVLVSLHTPDCLVENELSAKLMISDDKQYCTVNELSKDSKKGIVTIEIFSKIGELTCVSWRYKRRNEQVCKVAIKERVPFELPARARSIKSSCNFVKEVSSRKEEGNIYCPVVFDASISAKICESFPSPITFWISIFWLFLGIPFLWLSKIMYTKINLRIECRKLMNKKKCTYCNVFTTNIVEEGFHSSCKLLRCAYCSKMWKTLNELRLHCFTCFERKGKISDSQELVLHKINSLYDKVNYSGTYLSKRLKLEWLLLFVILIIVGSLPATDAMYTLRECPCVSTAIRCQDHFRRLSSPLKVTETQSGSKWSPGQLHPQSVESEDEAIEGPSNEDLAEMIISLTEAVSVTQNLLLNIPSIDTLKHIINDKISEKTNAIQDSIEMNCQGIDYKPMSSKDIIDTEHEEVFVRINPDDANNLKVTIMNSMQNMNFGSRRRTQAGKTESDVSSLSAQGGGAINLAGNSELQISAGSGHPFIAAANSSISLPSSIADAKFAEEKETPETTIIRPHRTRHSRWRTLWKSAESKLKRTKRSRAPERSFESLLDFDGKRRDRKNNLLEKVKKNDIESKLSLSHKWANESIAKSSNKSIFSFSQRTQILETSLAKKFKYTHAEWNTFSGSKCHLTCLHIPGQCKCIEDGFDEDGEFHLPWAVITAKDIIAKSSAEKIVEIALRETPDDLGNIVFDGVAEGSFELYEGMSIKFQVITNSVKNAPEISVVIPKIAQIYSTKFLYYTCERVFSAQMKGVCVGECNGYCGGEFCLGNRIWTWSGCRNARCNPMWCWNIGGCCCCGLGVHCKSGGQIAAVWGLRYEKTEYLVCILVNNKAQVCKTISETGSHEFGNLKLSLERPVGIEEKLPSTIVTIHSKTHQSTSKNSFVYGPPEKVYADMEVCTSATDCNHGFVGDVQISKLECLTKLGYECFNKESDLSRSSCAGSVYINYNGVQMDYSCNMGNWHTCSANHLTREIKFEDYLTDAIDLSDKFVFKKLETNLNSNSLLIYTTPKETSGVVNYIMEIDEMIIAKRDIMPQIKNLKLNDCGGCHSCTIGFKCTVSLTLDSQNKFLMKMISKTDGITLTDSVIEIHTGKNSFKIWGHSFFPVEDGNICLTYGDSFEKCSKTNFKLTDPTGKFIPNFVDSESDPSTDDAPSCSGFGFFSCIWSNIVGYGNSWWTIITDTFYVALVGLLIFLIIMAFPYISKCCSVIKLLKPKKASKKYELPTTLQANQILYNLRQARKNTLEAGHKKDDDSEIVPLFADSEIIPNQ